MGGAFITDFQRKEQQTLIDRMLSATNSSGKDAAKDTCKAPSEAIERPRSHDVLCGRGGLTNHHVGNVNFRKLVGLNKKLYATSPKRHKIVVSLSIMESIRRQDPPGRFLQRDAKTGLWYDIGRKKALHKTSQALREGGVEIPQEDSMCNKEDSNSDGNNGNKRKRIRGAAMTKSSGKCGGWEGRSSKKVRTGGFSPSTSPTPVSDCEDDDEASVNSHTDTVDTQRISCDSTCAPVSFYAENTAHHHSSQLVAVSPPPALLEPTPFFSKRRQLNTPRRVSRSNDYDDSPFPSVDAVDRNKDSDKESLPSCLEAALMGMENDGTTIDNILPLGVDFDQESRVSKTNPLMDDDDHILMQGLSFFLENAV